MNTNEIRKLYDDADNLHRMVKNMSEVAKRNISDAHWSVLKSGFDRMIVDSGNFLGYMAERVIPELNQHPDLNRSGGIYIDGVRQ